MIAIIDYDAGNTFNVQKALAYIGLETVLTADSATILNADGVLLPGVGAYAPAMAVLKERGLVDVIYEVVKRDIPLLGICLGMQLFPGKVKEIPRNLGLSVPHMGWNKNIVHHPDSAFSNVDDQYTYFVHSYYVDTDPEYIISTANYGIDVPGIVERGRVYGMQFHPEKSGVVGLNLLRTFGTITKTYRAAGE